MISARENIHVFNRNSDKEKELVKHENTITSLRNMNDEEDIVSKGADMKIIIWSTS